MNREQVTEKPVQSSVTSRSGMTDVQNSLQALKIFGIGASEIEGAEKQGVPIAPELAVRSPISGVAGRSWFRPAS